MNAHARAETCAFRSGASVSSGLTSLGQLGLELEARQLEAEVKLQDLGTDAVLQEKLPRRRRNSGQRRAKSRSAQRCCAAMMASSSLGSDAIGACAEALAGSFCGCGTTNTGLISAGHCLTSPAGRTIGRRVPAGQKARPGNTLGARRGRLARPSLSTAGTARVIGAASAVGCLFCVCKKTRAE